jgi:hypothetical protein
MAMSGLYLAWECLPKQAQDYESWRMKLLVVVENEIWSC